MKNGVGLSFGHGKSAKSLNKKLALATIMALTLGFGSAAQASENFGLPKDVSKIQQKDFRIRHLRTQAPQKLVVNNDVKTTSSGGKISVLTGTPTGAAAPTPTLDDMQSKAPTVLPTLGQYTLTELTGSMAVPDGAQVIGFNGKRYYFTPAETTVEKANMLSYLAGSMAAAYTTTGASSTNYLFTDGTNYWTIDTTKLPTSSYTLTAAETPAHWGIDINGTTYDLQMRDQGTGDQSLYFKWDTTSGRKLTPDGATSESNDLVVKANGGTGDSATYYKWVQSNGNWQLTTEGADSEHYNFIGKHDATSLNRVSTGTGQDVTGDFFGKSISSSSSYES